MEKPKLSFLFRFVRTTSFWHVIELPWIILYLYQIVSERWLRDAQEMSTSWNFSYPLSISHSATHKGSFKIKNFSSSSGRLLRTCLLVSVTFLVCWFPFACINPIMQAHPTWFDVPYGFVVLEVSIWLGNGREFHWYENIMISHKIWVIGYDYLIDGFRLWWKSSSENSFCEVMAQKSPDR